MRKLYLVILFFTLFLDPITGYTDEFGHWEYWIPKESSYKLIPHDNGLYLQFEGSTVLNSELALQFVGNGNYRIFLVLNESQIKKFPYSRLARIQKPKLIELVKSSSLAKNIISKFSKDIPKKGYSVIANAIVKIHNFNIGGDCGIVGYFVFKYKVNNIKIKNNYKYIEEEDC